MKMLYVLWMAFGSILTIAFNYCVLPFIDIIIGDKNNEHNIRTTRAQCEINKLSRVDANKTARQEAPLGNPIGFIHEEAEIYYEEDDDDYEDRKR